MALMKKITQLVLMTTLLMAFQDNPPANLREIVSPFQLLTASSDWTLKSKIKPDFEIFHTQGMVKIDNHFFVSAVEVLEPTETYAKSDNLWDSALTRTPGKGRGWLFKMDEYGKLLDKVELTNGNTYHPGGIDFDGEYIWVPVAEYRPNSESDIYRIDPATMHATLAFHVSDHVGTIIHNPERGTFHGSSWGSRRVYRWVVDVEPDGEGVINEELWHPNPSHYIDYQDCHYQGESFMLCGGVKNYSSPNGDMALGGIELIDTENVVPVLLHTLPVNIYWNNGMAITNNPFWMEEMDGLLRFYFLPDQDGEAELLTYEVARP